MRSFFLRTHALILIIALLAAACLTAVLPPAARAQDLPEEAFVCCVYGSPQTYTLSCEARAAVDWAAFFGFSISEYDFMMALPASDNPEKGFVGYWNGTWGNIPPDSYGVHPPPVVETLRSFGVPAEAHQDLTWDDLRREIAAGRPVIVWVIAQMWPGTAVDYTDMEGHTTRVAPFEHTMILTGYSAASVRVVDALTGKTKYFYLDSFLTSWAVLGRRAIFAGEPLPAPTPTLTTTPTMTPTPTPTPTPSPTPTPVWTHLVVPGDSLLVIAQVRDIPWRSLAEANDLVYPYFIYPGDLLLIPFWLQGQPQID
jgi:uncharacterized protein YvpB